MPDYYQVLDTAEQLLIHGWVHGREAVNSDGVNVLPWAEDAEKWCVLGSVKAASYHLDNGGLEYEKSVKYCMTVITTANLSIIKRGQGNYVENENDASSQERAIEMVQRGKEFYLAHPVGTVSTHKLVKK